MAAAISGVSRNCMQHLHLGAVKGELCVCERLCTEQRLPLSLGSHTFASLRSHAPSWLIAAWFQPACRGPLPCFPGSNSWVAQQDGSGAQLTSWTAAGTVTENHPSLGAVDDQFVVQSMALCD